MPNIAGPLGPVNDLRSGARELDDSLGQFPDRHRAAPGNVENAGRRRFGYERRIGPRDVPDKNKIARLPAIAMDGDRLIPQSLADENRHRPPHTRSPDSGAARIR